MASLSEDMRHKRDVKRKLSVLIADSDLGNYGLYMSILSMEYDIEYANSLEEAEKLCYAKVFDAVIADIDMGIDNMLKLFDTANMVYGHGEAVCLIIVEQSDKVSILKSICHEAVGFVAKPFSKEGLSGSLHNALKTRREEKLGHSIVIIDRDLSVLKRMKEELKEKYRVELFNTHQTALGFIKVDRTSIVFIDVDMFDVGTSELDKYIEEIRSETKATILLTTGKPVPELVEKCASFDTGGFFVKPVNYDRLKSTMERIILMESYLSDKEKRREVQD